MKIKITEGGPAVNGNLISVYICSKFRDAFPKCVSSIAQTATSKNYEIIVKVDSLEDQQHRQSILEKLGVRYTIVLSDATGYANIHVMHNQAVSVAKGDLFWGMGDDCFVIGDWYGDFRKVQKQYPDNIFVINTRFGKNWAVCPVVSRGWYEVLGYVSACPTNDGFLQMTGIRCGRYPSLPLKSDVRITHDQAGKAPKSVRKAGYRTARRQSKHAARILKAAIKDFRAKNPNLVTA